MATDRLLGTILDGRYLVKRFIGRGGMGSVYEGEQLALGRKVAIKVLPDDVKGAEREQFRREAKLASRVVHEHVVQVFEVLITPDGREAIVMELVEGRDLGHVLREDVLLHEDRAIAIAREMLAGLAAIHAQGIVHRDVKPSNVLLVPRGDGELVKIVDFGIARAAGDTSLTRTGNVVGTAQYMSPEQFRGLEIDARSDLYAVGVTLYAMLAGRVPFDGRAVEIGAKHVYEKPPSLDTLRPGLTRGLVATVERALAKSPAARFADARAFGAALSGHALLEVPEATVATVADRSSHEQPRRRVRWPWLVALVAVVAGGTLGTLLARRGAAPVSSIDDAGMVTPADAAIETPRTMQHGE